MVKVVYDGYVLKCGLFFLWVPMVTWVQLDGFVESRCGGLAGI